MRKLLQTTFYKSLLVTGIFIVIHLLYNIEYIRSHIEDTGFDITNKIVFSSYEQNIDAPKIMLFGFDDLYMKSEALFDDQNKTNYGYLFPRDKIAQFVETLDELALDAETQNIPKALFIDYDMSYSSLPYGKELSKEDIKFLNVLKKDRPYNIILVKNDANNFVEHSKNKKIQELIKNKKIMFASVKLLTSSDGIARRYLSYKKYRDANQTKVYPSIDILLWQLSRSPDVNITSIQKNFKEKDIVANRIIMKAYKKEYIEEGCKVSDSYWTNYTKYSVNCSPFEIPEEDFSNAIILLGGTYTLNSDEFETFGLGSSSNMKGIELHANALMSIFAFNGQLQRISLFYGTLLIFCIYFMVDFSVSYIFKLKSWKNEKIYLFLILALITILVVLVSLYLLLKYKVWFNWFIAIILFQLYEIILYLNVKFKKNEEKSDEILVD